MIKMLKKTGDACICAVDKLVLFLIMMLMASSAFCITSYSSYLQDEKPIDQSFGFGDINYYAGNRVVSHAIDDFFGEVETPDLIQPHKLMSQFIKESLTSGRFDGVSHPIFRKVDYGEPDSVGSNDYVELAYTLVTYEDEVTPRVISGCDAATCRPRVALFMNSNESLVAAVVVTPVCQRMAGDSCSKAVHMAYVYQPKQCDDRYGQKVIFEWMKAQESTKIPIKIDSVKFVPLNTSCPEY